MIFLLFVTLYNTDEREMLHAAELIFRFHFILFVFFIIFGISRGKLKRYNIKMPRYFTSGTKITCF
jgi:hypothetical protein